MDDASDAIGSVADPGPIDNSSLFNGMYFHLYYVMFVREIYSIICCTESHYLIDTYN